MKHKLYLILIILLLSGNLLYAIEGDEDLGIIIFPRINSFLRMHIAAEAQFNSNDYYTIAGGWIIFGVGIANMKIAIWEVDRDIIAIGGQSISKKTSFNIGIAINFYPRGNVYILYGSGYKATLDLL